MKYLLILLVLTGCATNPGYPDCNSKGRSLSFNSQYVVDGYWLVYYENGRPVCQMVGTYVPKDFE